MTGDAAVVALDGGRLNQRSRSRRGEVDPITGVVMHMVVADDDIVWQCLSAKGEVV